MEFSTLCDLGLPVPADASSLISPVFEQVRPHPEVSGSNLPDLLERAAERTRGSLAGAVMHTDHGSQYTSRAFAEIYRSAGPRQSMGAIGPSSDNTAAESFNAAFKRDTPEGRKAWSSKREARLDAFRRLTRYNTQRRHSHLGQRSPTAYENNTQPTATTVVRAA